MSHSRDPQQTGAQAALAAIVCTVLLVKLGGTALADQVVSGEITGPTTWTAAESPYIVQGITVTSSGSLTIEPGVVVKFDVNPYITFVVDGTLTAVGTAGFSCGRKTCVTRQPFRRRACALLQQVGWHGEAARTWISTTPTSEAR